MYSWYILAPHTNWSTDDILLYKAIRKSDDFTHLQASSCLTFNPLICKLMVVTRKQCPANPPILTLGTHAIARVHQFTYLGITITADLSWDAHIHALCTKVRKTLGLLYRKFYANASASSLFKLYISLIRPSLEYACQVWNPHLSKDIEKVQSLLSGMC